ncbi:restriction endonuclease subunit S [uncultured Campylobacter sp.]|uniref:restriction endonuclease subunit S n=1 Tax=uncultured Campylobacter sp. TaxID=218934 RepID=UPI00260EE746|nr:restriction endonuclease subunit S [uncultured Campylobacter sp.]
MAKIKKDTNLRKSILQAAITGQLISDVEGETKTGKQLLDKIIEERNAKLLADWEEAKKKNPKAKKPAPIVVNEIAEDEIPFEIPENWCWCRLGEIINYKMGKTPPRAESEWWGTKEGTPWISIADMVSDGYINTTKETMSSKSVKEIFNNNISKAGTLIMSFKLTVGRVSILNIDATHNEAIISIFPFIETDNILRNYLFKILPIISQNGETKDAIKGKTLNSSSIYNMILPLPPLAVQNGIVAKLEEVLPLVDAYENAVLQKEELKNALPDKVKKAILQEAIQGKLTEEWRKTATIEETGKQLLDKIIEERNKKLLADWEEAKKKNPKAKKSSPIAASEIAEDEIPFEIPENWCWCRLSNLCNLYTGNSINETEKKLKYTNIKDGWVYIGTKDVGFDQTINYDNGIKIPFEKDTFRIAPKNTVLMCIEGGSAGRKIAFTNQDVCFGNKLCCFNPYKYEIEKFLFYFLQSTVFTDAFKDNINGIIGGVSINKIKEMLFPLPPLAEQEKIVEIIERMLPLCEKLGG